MRTTDRMGLKIPDVGEPSPQWTQAISDSFDAVDAHDHLASGAKITQDALQISDALSLGGNPLTDVASVRLAPQTLSPIGAGRLYADASGNLYFRSGTDLPVQITAGGNVVGSAGGIGGDFASSGAAVDYDSALKRYRLKAQDATFADVEARNVFPERTQFKAATGLTGARSLYSENGQLVYRDGNDVAIQLTTNGHASGGDIRGDYAAGAEVTYSTSDKRYTFKDATLANADVEGKNFRGDGYVYRTPAVRRYYTSAYRTQLIAGAARVASSFEPLYQVTDPGGICTLVVPVTLPASRTPGKEVLIKAWGCKMFLSGFPVGNGPTVYLTRMESVLSNTVTGAGSAVLKAGGANASLDGQGYWVGAISYGSGSVQSFPGDSFAITVTTASATGAQMNLRSFWADVITEEADVYST